MEIHKLHNTIVYKNTDQIIVNMNMWLLIQCTV